MTYMLDTNICIYAIKKKPEKVLQRLLDHIDEGICISSITLAELEYGIKHSSNPEKKWAGPYSLFSSDQYSALWCCSCLGVRRNQGLPTR